ncbi:MAG: rhodanese-related sulfurtransferase [Acidobacteriota bacterium]
MPPEVTIYTGYRFLPLHDPESLRRPAEDLCRGAGLRGTILLAEEGVNLTLAGDSARLSGAWTALERLIGTEVVPKISQSAAAPFGRLQVKVRREIVTFGQAQADPLRRVGEYVSPRQWDALVADPEVLVIDTRNDYEVAAGRFEGAVDPKTADFTEFADYVDDEMVDWKQRPIAMYCTGGIRCEKATSFLLSRGFETVYHLEGGILSYLEQTVPEESRFEGECFVFDDRITVDAQLAPGRGLRCRTCGWPLEAEDLELPSYEEGVSCLHCHGRRSADEIERARERQRQLELRAERAARTRASGSA